MDRPARTVIEHGTEAEERKRKRLRPEEPHRNKAGLLV